MDLRKLICSKEKLLFFVLLAVGISDSSAWSLKEGNCTLSFSEQNSTGTLLVDCPEPGQAKVFALTSPSRIVIDLPPAPKTAATTNSAKDASGISRIRVATDSTKTRVVLDLASKEAPKITLLPDGGKLTVQFPLPSSLGKPTEPSSSKEIPTTSPPEVEPTATKSSPPPPTPTALPSATPTSPSENNHSKDDSVSPPQSVTEKASSSVLTEVRFVVLTPDQIPALRIGFESRPPQYETRAKDERTYLINIPSCDARKETLLLPQFPPKEFPGFTYVSPKKKEGRMEILIGVERGVKLEQLPLNNDIFFKATLPEKEVQ